LNQSSAHANTPSKRESTLEAKPGAPREAVRKFDAAAPIPDSMQAEYDALADLFLNDDAPTPADVLRTIGPAVDAPVVNAAPVAPVAPAPIARPAPRTFTTPEEDIEALLATAAPIRSKRTPSPAANSNRVEGLVLGHLPVLASAWAVQYARHIAEETQTPVSLLRIQGGTLSLELVFADSRQAVAVRAGGPTADLEEAMTRASTIAPRLMIRVDDTAELDLPRAARVGRMTLLTGADDMAVVACYRTLKHMLADVSTGIRLEGDTAPSHGASLGIAIMGADPDGAAQAEQKIRRSAMTFLSRSLDSVAIVPKIGSCSTALLYRGPAPLDAPSVFELTASLWNSPAAPSVAPVNQPVRHSPQQTPRHADVHTKQRPRMQPAAQPVQAPAPQPPVQLAAPQRVPQPINAHSLSQYLGGLTSLRIRCPYCADVELATDDEGVLHLLAATAGLGGARQGSEAVEQLVSAASWADDHSELLALAFPVLSQGASKPGPILHLITDEPRASRALLGTGVRVHLATPIDIDGGRTWFCRDLN
jgi:hypothetical protein